MRVAQSDRSALTAFAYLQAFSSRTTSVQIHMPSRQNVQIRLDKHLVVTLQATPPIIPAR